ncbi:uncharacterized protein LOC120074323 [Benincasa hispida]|uniref:uncharacterized protein LOC120074323 n=1 Tax=Benincasa hispida TaxID=102211 RepID=UPI0018FFD098|nr:uncharacterized protein LOC120074323 [Benincasa hispida]XP_038883340.1 uncharacterized protein LOC120074323 [Benincasa hispida]
MASIHPSELDSNATDSVASSPRSDHHFNLSNDPHARVRFMCSFGGNILPRPHDNQLRYVGGETRIVAVQRSTTFSHFLAKLAKITGTINMSIKYQLPNEDLDALISVSTDEDVENMMDEYDRLVQNHNPKSARLRLFLFPRGEDSRASSINSLLGGSTNRDHWFLDALNGGAPVPELERGRSEVSSIVSEVPDYLFGLDNQDDTSTHLREPKSKTRFNLNPSENVSVSDPGSPSPVVPSATCVNSMPNLPPVKTRPDTPSPSAEPVDKTPENCEPPSIPFSQPPGFPNNPMMHYFPGTNYPGHHQPVVYLLPGQIPPGNVPVQHIPIQTQPQYVQQFPPVGGGQVPLAYHHPVTMAGQVYGGGMGPVSGYDPQAEAVRIGADGVSQQMYYGVQNTARAPPYAVGTMGPPVAEELRGSGSETRTGNRVSP